MSTKIYNAYLMNGVNAVEFNAFIKALKDECLERGVNKLQKMSIQMVKKIIDMGCMYEDPELYNQIFHVEPQELLANLYRESYDNLRSKILNNSRTTTTEQCMSALRKYKHLNVSHLTAEIVHLNAQYFSVLRTLDFSEYDIECSMAVFPVSSKRIAFMTFGSILNDLLHEISNAKQGDKWFEWKERFAIRDFHYQNQTDKPNDISAREWNNRRKIWDRILPTGIPSEDGILITILSAQLDTRLISRLRFGQGLVSVLDDIPSKDVRASQYAKQLTIDTLATSEMSYSQLMDVVNQVCDDIESHGSSYPMYMQYRERVLALLPDITEDMLSKQCTDFFSL